MRLPPTSRAGIVPSVTTSSVCNSQIGFIDLKGAMKVSSRTGGLIAVCIFVIAIAALIAMIGAESFAGGW